MTPDNSISVVYTPGRECGFVCNMCNVARQAWLKDGPIRDLQIIIPDDVRKVNRYWEERGKRIAFQKLAGVAGDVFFLDSNPDWDMKGTIDAMIEGLYEPQVARDPEVGGRVHVVSTMADVTTSAVNKLKNRSNYILAQLSVGVHHHNGGKRFCREEFESLTEMINSGHVSRCKYFEKTKEGVDMVKSVVGFDNVVTLSINRHGLESLAVLDSFLRTYYGLALEDDNQKSLKTVNISTPVNPAVLGSENTAISEKPGNRNLQFVTKENSKIRLYGSYPELLAHRYYEEI